MAITKEIISNALLANEKYSSYTLTKLMRNTKDTLLKMFEEIDGDLGSLEPIKEKKTKMAKVDLAISSSNENLGMTYSMTHYDMFKEHNDKNIFEDVIDNLMIDEILGKDIKYRDDKDVLQTLVYGSPEHSKAADEFKADVLNPLNKAKKRLKILKFLSEQNSVYVNIINIIKKKESKFSYIKDVIRELRDYVKVGEVEKKLYGEVMTPLELVKDMMSTLPEETWSNPDLKIFDPANGCGPFPAYVIYKLMVGLAEWQPDEDLRYKHIIENMIYVCELQPKNMFLWLFTIDPKDEYKPNIYCGSFLESGFDFHMKNVWGIEKFDIVIGNPPFNSGQLAEGKRGGGDTLWDQFVIKILNNILINKGYLCFVHPTLWRKPQSEKSSTKNINRLMLSKQIHYLEMHDSKDGLKVFNAGTRFDFYLLQNTNIFKNTKIKDEDKKNIELDLKNYEFIANKNNDFLDKIIAKPKDIKCPIIFNVSNYESRKPWVSEVKNEDFKYTLVHTTPMKGNRYLYSSRNDNGHFGISKVIFGDSGIYDVVIDLKGEYGMTQHAMGIEVSSEEEALSIKNAILSQKFRIFLESVLWSNFQIDWRLFTFLKKDFWKEFI